MDRNFEATFCARHVEDFAGLFRETVHLARTAGLAKLGVVTVAGNKIRANTSRHKAMSYGRMRKEEERLEVEIAEILEKIEEVNRGEDECAVTHESERTMRCGARRCGAST